MGDENEASGRRLALAIDTNERHRGRSRATANLVAAAAAGLIAALVLSPPTFMPSTARIIGVVAVSLFVIATSLFIAASLVYSGKKFFKSDPGTKALGLLLFWRIPPHTDTASPTDEQVAEATRRVQARITHIVNAAVLIAGGGVIALAWCFVSTVLDQDEKVSFTLYEPEQLGGVCPEYSEAFPARVNRGDMASSAGDVRLQLAARDCGVQSDIVVYLPKSAALFTSASK